jgi:acetyl-CoA carboxylase biotin carboxyl carrier protein
MLGFDEIAEILKIIDASSCDEVVIETDELKLVVRRNGAAAPAAPAAPAVPPQREAAAISAAAAAPPRGRQPLMPSAGRPAAASGQIEITAPMLGTFYRSPSPGAPPFVEIGNVVRKGDPVCLIEVMKLFTTIYAEADGKVSYIGAENGAFVEFGQTLFVLDHA